MTTYDDGGGVDLYAGGEFTFIGTLAVANFVARWNGSTWTDLGAGVTGAVNALLVFDDGAPGGGRRGDLYAGGAFTRAGIVSANNIARWDGTTWSALAGDGGASGRRCQQHGDCAGGG